MIRITIPSAHETIERHAQAGWQCPECYGIRVQRHESRFAGPSADRFTCEECGAMWGRMTDQENLL